MNKAEKAAYKAYPYNGDYRGQGDSNSKIRGAYINGYHQAEKDIKEELSKLFQEFMLDCINDDTETHILHFVDVFNNKLKMIGNE